MATPPDAMPAELAAAKAAGDFVRYRFLRVRSERFYAHDPVLSQR